MKAAEQYFHVVLFIMLGKVVPSCSSVQNSSHCFTIQLKATERVLYVFKNVVFRLDMPMICFLVLMWEDHTHLD